MDHAVGMHIALHMRSPLKRPTLWAGLIAAALVLAACSSGAGSDPAADAAPAEAELARQVRQGEPRVVGTGEVAEGACLALPDLEGELSSLFEVSCVEDHNGQVAAVFDLSLEGDFPGQDAIVLEAQTGCVARFEDFIGLSYDDSIYFLQSFTPTEESWTDLGDRSVLCLILPPIGNDQLVGDLRGVAE